MWDTRGSPGLPGKSFAPAAVHFRAEGGPAANLPDMAPSDPSPLGEATSAWKCKRLRPLPPGPSPRALTSETTGAVRAHQRSLKTWKRLTLSPASNSCLTPEYPFLRLSTSTFLQSLPSSPWSEITTGRTLWQMCESINTPGSSRP